VSGASSVIERLRAFEIRPDKSIGQHFLEDQFLIDLMVRSVNPGDTIIEIGSGVGQLTEALAQKAGRVISIEIDRRYEPMLLPIAKKYPNVQIIFGDAIALRIEDLVLKERDTKIVANLPFHITEPFLRKIANLPIDSAILLVGRRLAYATQAIDEESPYFSKLTLLVQTFFHVEFLATIEKGKFYPVPPADSAIIRFIPREENEIRSNSRDFILRKLFLAGRKSSLVKNCLKDGLVEYADMSRVGNLPKKEQNKKLRRFVARDLKCLVEEFNQFGKVQTFLQYPSRKGLVQLTQNQAKDVIEQMRIPDRVLNKLFDQLDNIELGLLSKALRQPIKI